MFLTNILERYKGIKFINDKTRSAYTVNKSIIYFNPTKLLNVN
jgi:hypothetical protein